MTKREWLQAVAELDGNMTEYPFIEWGYVHVMNELLKDGLIMRIPRPGDLAVIRITEKGREFLSTLK